MRIDACSALGLQELAAAINDRARELHLRVKRRVEWLLGQTQLGRRHRFFQVLGIEQLEIRMLLSASPVGGETLVNTVAVNTQKDAGVASDGAGNFVVVWEGNDADKGGIYFQRFDSSGNAEGGETLVNTTTVGNEKNAAVAMDSNGHFVVAWDGGGPGNSDGVFLQRYNGSPTASPDSYTVNEDNTLNVAAAGVLGNDIDSLSTVLVAGHRDINARRRRNGPGTGCPAKLGDSNPSNFE